LSNKHGFYQGLLLATTLILCVVALFRNFDQLSSLLLIQNLNEWISFGIFSSLSALLINQLYAKIFQKYQETRTGIKYIAISFFVVMVATYLVFRFQGNKDYQTSLALFVSSCLLGAGWWVQATISSAAARKAHTVNTIMNQRNSELFIQKNDNLIKVFPRKKTIPPVFAEYLMDVHNKKYKDAIFPEEYLQGARDLAYVLNYYEFIAVGVINGDFDEKLMRECFVGILIALEKRAYLVIQSAQKQSPKTFESIVELVDRWSEQKSLTTRSKSNQNIDTFEIYPPQEEIDKMMCAANSVPPAAAEMVATAVDLTLVAAQNVEPVRN
jgi:tryptophan-rich sensory protein